MNANTAEGGASHGQPESMAPTPAWDPSITAKPISPAADDVDLIATTLIESGATEEERLPVSFERVMVVPSRLSQQLGLPPVVNVILSDKGIGVASLEGDLLLTERYLMIQRFSQGVELCSLEFGTMSHTPGVLHLAVGDDFAHGTSNPPRLGLNDRIREASHRVAHRPDAASHFAEVLVIPTLLSASLNLPVNVAVTLSPHAMRVSGARVKYTLPYTDIQRFGTTKQDDSTIISLLFGPGAVHPGVLHFVPATKRATEFAARLRTCMYSPPTPPYRFEYEGDSVHGYVLEEAAEPTPASLHVDAELGIVYYDGVRVVESNLSKHLALPQIVTVKLDRTSITIGNDVVCLHQPHEAIKRYAINGDATLCSLELGGAYSNGYRGLIHLGFTRGGAEFHGLLSEYINTERPGEGTTSL